METSKADYAYLSKYIDERAAIQIGADKAYLLDARLGPLCRDNNFPGMADLIVALREGKNQQLETDVMDALTTNETLWYRDGHPWEALRDSILPDLKAKLAPLRAIRIWCAASSTGQEPYSLAMMILERFPELLQWDFSFLATDLSTKVLERARAGVYSAMELNRGLPEEYRNRHFEPETGNRWRISERLRTMIKFERLNLLDPFHHLGRFDLIMMRNVLIYFDAPTKAMILNKVSKHLQPNGYFMLGTSEATLDVETPLLAERVDKTTVYRGSSSLRRSA